MKISQEKAKELFKKGRDIIIIDDHSPKIPTTWSRADGNFNRVLGYFKESGWNILEFQVPAVVSKFNGGKGINHED